MFNKINIIIPSTHSDDEMKEFISMIKNTCNCEHEIYFITNKEGITQLTDLVVKGKVNKVIVEHKDRLTRFQFNFIKKMYAVFGCEIVVLDDKEDVSDAEELTRDLMALLASFSGKYYGRRSLERRKQNKVK